MMNIINRTKRQILTFADFFQNTTQRPYKFNCFLSKQGYTTFETLSWSKLSPEGKNMKFHVSYGQPKFIKNLEKKT